MSSYGTQPLTLCKDDPCFGLDLDTPIDINAPLDERDVVLVQKTWERAARLGAPIVGKVLFMQIFKLAPEAIALFPFAHEKEEGLDLYRVGGPLTDYGTKIVTTLNVAIGMLTDLP